jgi:tetratricopeptide (TPR) repeat protein
MLPDGAAVEHLVNTSERYYETFLDLDMLLKIGNYGEIDRNSDEMMELNPTSESFALSGAMLIEIGNYSSAFESLNKSLKIDPGNAEAWWLKGFIYADKNETNQSLM